VLNEFENLSQNRAILPALKELLHSFKVSEKLADTSDISMNPIRIKLQMWNCGDTLESWHMFSIMLQ
jgi:hypothetical protein